MGNVLEVLVNHTIKLHCSLASDYHYICIGYFGQKMIDMSAIMLN